MDGLAIRTAARYAASLVTPEYIEVVLKGLDQGNAPDAARLLQSLVRSLRGGGLDPFPIAELEAYLRDRGVAEDELELVRKVRVHAPREKARELNFSDAVLRFGRETGVSVVPDMRFDTDPKAGKAVLGWLEGVKKLKTKARKVWDRMVKKVHLGRGQGSEEASWGTGGILHLSVTTTVNPANAASILTHELGHAFEEMHGLSGKPPWGEPPFVTQEAEYRAHYEDIAESFRAFVNEPSLLKAKCPEKYDILRSLI